MGIVHSINRSWGWQLMAQPPAILRTHLQNPKASCQTQAHCSHPLHPTGHWPHLRLPARLALVLDAKNTVLNIKDPNSTVTLSFLHHSKIPTWNPHIFSFSHNTLRVFVSIHRSLWKEENAFLYTSNRSRCKIMLGHRGEDSAWT
jgi:hypothetical protein